LDGLLAGWREQEASEGYEDNQDNEGSVEQFGGSPAEEMDEGEQKQKQVRYVE
jgi:hypothetical protein